MGIFSKKQWKSSPSVNATDSQTGVLSDALLDRIRGGYKEHVACHTSLPPHKHDVDIADLNGIDLSGIDLSGIDLGGLINPGLGGF